MIDVVASRLHAQRLNGNRLRSAVDAVRLFGAVQSQDYAGAKWALGQRTMDSTNGELDDLFNDGRILRTHVMRPTWHFVLPEDARWLQSLTGGRVRRSLAGRFRELGLNEQDIARGVGTLCEALSGGRFLTRAELGAVLRESGISPDGLRLTHLLMAAELDGDIVSGPRRGKQFTYALLAERAPQARTLHREEALAELAGRYFRGHGPAGLQDFVWWSGLTTVDARLAVTLAGDNLEHALIGDTDYWFDGESSTCTAVKPVVHLLPNWDEYTVGYRDRSAIHDPRWPFDPSLFAFGSVLSNIVTIAGHVRGTWRRSVERGSVCLEIRAVPRLDCEEVSAVEAVGAALGRFHELPVQIDWQ